MNAGQPYVDPQRPDPQRPDPLDETWQSVDQVFSEPPAPTEPAPPMTPYEPYQPYEPTPPLTPLNESEVGVPQYFDALPPLPAETAPAPQDTAPQDIAPQEPAPQEPAPPVPTLGIPLHSGPKPPLYPPEPHGVPAVRNDPTAALIPDMVVDGAAYGPLTVRAASVRGDSHRYQNEPRQDSLAVTRIGVPGQGPRSDELLLLAVADGVGSAARSHVGSQQACRLAAMHLDAVATELATALRAGDPHGFAALVEPAVRSVGTLLTHHAHERRDDPAAYATTLRALLVPLDPEIRTRGFLAVGDGGTALLRDAEWNLSVTDAEQDAEQGADGMIDTRTAALPLSHSVHARLLGPALPGDVLVLCTDGLSTPLAGDAGMRDFLRSAWGTGTVPAPADFLWQFQYRVKSYDDDRTAVVVWEGTP
ncbi:protein phosphatase 2C domain-containing protein [Streptomyces sp. SD15]